MARISGAGVLLLTGTISMLGSLNAQTCAGTQGFSGPYVFTAVRLAYVGQSTNPPGTTTGNPPIFVPQPTAAPGTTGEYSMTPIGQLVGASSNAAPFSGVGRIYADGAGVLFAQKGDDPAYSRVGTYTVSNQCVVTMTINDAFATTTTGTNSQPGVTYQGVITNRGDEATVIQTSQGSGVLLRFARPFLAAGCSQNSLGGNFGLFGLGVDLGTPSGSGSPAATTPLTFASQFTADGAGMIGTQVNSTTPGYTGTYSVKPDCTGTLSLISPDKATTRKFAFVLTGTPAAPGQLPRASVQLVLDSPGQYAGFAEAR